MDTRQTATSQLNISAHDNPSVSLSRGPASIRHLASGWSGGGTAFVFSGGGARGALHVGALRALLEHGVTPDLLVGTSIGAWNAAWLARTPTLDGVEQLGDVWRSLSTAQVLLGRMSSVRSSLAVRCMLLASAVSRMVRGRSSLYDDAGMRHLLAQHFADATFEDLAVPLRVIAADLTHGGRAVFRSGPLVPCVLASSAIPGIFPPVHIGDGVYADGGTVDGCSIETAVELGARRIFVLAIGYDTEGDGGSLWSTSASPDLTADRRARGYSAAATIQRASQIMGNYQIFRALERVPRGVEVHLLQLSTGDGGGTLSFRNVSEWIDGAYHVTDEYLRSALPSRDPAPALPPDERVPALIA